MLGLGNLSSLGVGKEVTYGVAVPPTVYLPITQESLAAPRENVESGQLVGERMVQTLALGIKQLEGGFTLENDCASLGQPLKFWNGDTGYSVVNANTLSMILTAAPTGVVSPAGTVPVGTFIYSIALLIVRTIDLFSTIMPVSASSAGITTTLGNQTVTLTHTDLATFAPPLGFAVQGKLIYRTVAGGVAGTETLYDRVMTLSGTTYVDTGVPAAQGCPDPLVVPVASTTNLYRHRYIGTTPAPGVEPLPSFTVTVNKDNDVAEQYDGCRMNEFNIGASGGNTPTNAAFTLMGRNVVTVPNTTPTFTNLQQVLGWKTAAFVNGLSACTLIEAFDLKCTNSCEHVPGFCATPFNRDVASGMRHISGTIKRNFDNHEFFNRVQLGEEFALKFNMYGQGIVTSASSLKALTHGIDAIPFPFYMEIELFRCRTNKAGGNVSGPGRIIEDIEFKAFKSQAFGTEMRVTLYNTTPTYA